MIFVIGDMNGNEYKTVSSRQHDGDRNGVEIFKKKEKTKIIHVFVKHHVGSQSMSIGGQHCHL